MNRREKNSLKGRSFEWGGVVSGRGEAQRCHHHWECEQGEMQGAAGDGSTAGCCAGDEDTLLVPHAGCWVLLTAPPAGTGDSKP